MTTTTTALVLRTLITAPIATLIATLIPAVTAVTAGLARTVVGVVLLAMLAHSDVGRRLKLLRW
jgi:hypothetical protein